MPVLGNFCGGPFELGQCGDQAGNNAGFAYAARMSTNDDESHG
jgi:hypothetical protein